MNRRLRKAALAAACLTFLCGETAAFDLSEIDGDAAAGNAPILLGWEPHFFPLPFATDEDAPEGVTLPEFQAATQGAFEAWSDASQQGATFREAQVPGGELTPEVLAASIGPNDCENDGSCIHLVATVAKDWEAITGAGNGVIALTLIKFNPAERRIVDADIMLDDEHFDFATNFDGGTNPKRFDLQSILAHEVGHVLGVAHPAEDTRRTATMWSVTSSADVSLRTLEADDRHAARYLYSPLVAEIPDPDRNLFGLLPRSPSTASRGGNGGCEGGSRGGPWGLLGAWIVLLARALRRRLIVS